MKLAKETSSETSPRKRRGKPYAPRSTGWKSTSTGASAIELEFALVRENHPKPILTIREPRARGRGFQKIRLADHDCTLEPGVIYRWVIAVVRDPASRSRDIVSSARIQRVPPLPLARPHAADYALGGIW